MQDRKSIVINLGNYNKKGLYLLFGNSNVIGLTEDHIEKTTRRFWEDPERIPPAIRKNADFLPCSFCSEAGKETMCHALRPVLPFLEAIDRYWSHGEVTAIYRGDEERLMFVSDSDMQTALQYICLFGLLSYCRVGRRYRKYYYGVVPIMGTDAALKRLYLDIYWLYGGDPAQIKTAIDQFTRDMWTICGNIIKRLNLICTKDAFSNAFFDIQAAAELLAGDMNTAVAAAFDSLDWKEE